ncbi:hypothetical protein BEWA_011570 [Theileria equi strain WA]|uniref:Uncharacterized protein n=1 Tax=Theileria equi strain WA TaxID=1537102 RepID=L0B3R2_THEEQ|nr:hypothetical protein BEWA_011570 [Theileria equi strain WA]AFZ81739.1 hypothetical protein BEWA_011570 [Theileria equi strain WA]|eukprot:XP_004831405.1 hypothetical protein BEWA_011570 [Theileria equi strain WA]
MLDDRCSVLSPNFDPLILIDSITNLPLSDKLDVFYSSLTKDVEDEKLLKTLFEVKDSKISLGNLSHAIYLLPWSVQPVNECLKNRAASVLNDSSEKHTPNLKNLLQHFVARTKYEARLSEYLLGLRFTGYSYLRNACYNYLRCVYDSNKRVTVVCKSGNSISAPIRYKGNLDLFDRKLNILLANVQTDRNNRMSFMFISNNSIISIFT